MNQATKLHNENLDWYANVDQLSDEDFQSLITLLTNDLNNTNNFYISELLKAKIDLIKFNRSRK